MATPFSKTSNSTFVFLTFYIMKTTPPPNPNPLAITLPLTHVAFTVVTVVFIF